MLSSLIESHYDVAAVLARDWVDRAVIGPGAEAGATLDHVVQLILGVTALRVGRAGREHIEAGVEGGHPQKLEIRLAAGTAALEQLG